MTEKSEQKTYIKTLTAGDERLQFLAIKKKSGWSFFVLHQRVGADKKVKTLSRGAAAHYEDLASASKAVDDGAALAQADGWAKSARVGGGGFKSKADAFSLSALPKPGGTVVAAPAETPAPAEASATETPAPTPQPEGGKKKGKK